MTAPRLAAPRVPPLVPPTGTVTFFFSDIEGSTRLVDSLGPAWAEVLQLHRATMRGAFAEHGGVELGTEGDSFFVAFGDATAAVAAAVAATRRLAAIAWPGDGVVRVRIGLHTGEGRLVDGDYVGMDVHRAARIAAAAHGGQVIVSESTRILVARTLPPDVLLLDLGEHQLKDLPAPEHLYQLVIEGQPNAFPALRSLARTVANLPGQLASIIGREADIAAVRELVARSRLVTVTGPGGTGKTRLVQEVARAIVAAEAVDAAFVPFEALTDAHLMPTEILRALRLDTAAAREPLDRIVEHLASRPTLLVLDNLEQLPGAAGVVRGLLDRAPRLSILVASQVALHVAGEQQFALGPLASATDGGVDENVDGRPASTPAVALFVERARAVRADFELDVANAAAINAICARLDGLPLAIELAAAQVKLLSPEAILKRLEANLDALTSRREDIPARQRTLRATVAWSYELLGPDERRLFRRLAAFSGGARLEDVEALATVDPEVPDAVDVLGALVDRSLVRVRPGKGAEDRYSLFAAMQAHARALLREHGEEPPITLAHARMFRDLAAQAEPQLYGASRRMWLDRIAAEHDNMRTALQVLEHAGELNDALRMAADLWRFWQQRGHLAEGVAYLDRVLAAAQVPGLTTPELTTLSRAEEAAGSLRYWLEPDRRLAAPHYERALALAVASGDLRREAWARHNYAFAFDFSAEGFGEPELERATALRERALAMFRELDDRRGIGESLWAMGGSATVVLRDPGLARRLLTEAVQIMEGVGDHFGLGWASISLALIDMVDGDFGGSERRVLAAADVFTRDGDEAGKVLAVQALGALAARTGDDPTAVRLYAAAQATAEAIGAEVPRIPPVIEPIEAAVARTNPDVVARERAIGAAIGVESILSTALGARGGLEVRAAPAYRVVAGGMRMEGSDR